MRAFKLIPGPVLHAAKLSKDAIKRLEWIDWYYEHGKNISLTCRHFGISRDTFYLWFRRYNRRRLSSLEFNTKTRRPGKVREMTTPSRILIRIYDIREADPEKSKYEIHEELRREGISVAHNVIQKVINRHPELQNTQHRKKIKRHRDLKIARIKAARELRDRAPGSLVQIDTKYFYVLGHKFFLFSAIDCKTRYGFVYCYKTISSAPGADFVRRVREYFPFEIRAVNTDNGSEYLKDFHKEVESWGIPHFFTDPNCPKQNGRVERFHQTVEYEYFNYQDDLLPVLELINRRCMEFNDKYNNRRFHSAIGYKTPAEYVSLELQVDHYSTVRYV